MIRVTMTSELSFNEMTPLPISLAAVFLDTGNCSSKFVQYLFNYIALQREKLQFLKK